MAELVQQSDVEAALLRPLTEAEENYLPGLVNQAQALLRARVPDLDDRIALFYAGTLPPKGLDQETVAAVLAGAIARFIVNPDGATSTNQAVGPFSSGRTYSGDAIILGRGQLRITDADIAALLPPSSFSGARTIRTPARRWL